MSFFKTCEQSERYLLHSDSSTILYILYFSFSPMPPIQHFSDKSLNYIRKFLFVNTHSEKISDCSKKYWNRLKIGRSGEAQTRGLRIPNAARYQLRYTPIVIKLWSCKWSNLWSNTFLTAFYHFPNRPKSARLKGFRRFSLSCGAKTAYAPKPPALPTAPHPVIFIF